MNYVVQIVKDDRVWAQAEVEAPNRKQAAAVVLARAVDGFEELEDFNGHDEDEFPSDPEEVRESHEVTVRVHRVSPTPEEAREDYEIVKMMNEDPRSPFRGMIAMPPAPSMMEDDDGR